MSRHRRPWVAGAEVLAWAVLCTGIWVATLSAVSVPDVVTAGAVGLLCGGLATAGRRATGDRWHLAARWLRRAWLLPLAVPLDAVRLLWSACRGDGGGFETVRVTAGQGTGAAAEGRRAAYVVLVSATPASIVLDVDPVTGEALVHRVGSGAPDMAGQAAR